MHRLARVAPRLTPFRHVDVLPGPAVLFARWRHALSTEQQRIVELCASQNVKVIARPGSGKTATAEAVVAAYPGVATLVATYTRRLKLDTEKRLAPYPWATVTTFHALACKLSGQLVYTDEALSDFRKSGLPLQLHDIPDYKFIVIDKMQDMNEDLLWLAVALMFALEARSGVAPRLLCLGDPRQSLYEYRGGDSRYIELVDLIMKPASPYEWAVEDLSTSFRTSRATADFLNHCVLREQYITGFGDGPRPIYVHAVLSKEYINQIMSVLGPLIEQYGPQNTALLAPSVRTNWDLRPLTNYLSRSNVPVAISHSDEGILDDDITRGKLTVSTIHQFKGLERLLVLLWGFDNSYMHYFARAFPDDRYTNVRFLHSTRSRGQLVLLHDARQPPLPFFYLAALESFADFRNLANRSMKAQPTPVRDFHLPEGRRIPIAASEYARHARNEVLTPLIRTHTRVDKVAPSPDLLDISDKVCTHTRQRFWEFVADINGLAVTAGFEWHCLGTLNTLSTSANDFVDSRLLNISERALPSGVLFSMGQISALLSKCIWWEAHKSGYYSRYIQMKTRRRDWFSPKAFSEAISRLRLETLEHAVDPGLLIFERKMQIDLIVDGQETRMRGWPDIVLPPSDLTSADPAARRATIWEVKFTTILTNEHVAQLVAYAYMWSITESGPDDPFPRMILFNARTGEKWEIDTDAGSAYEMIAALLREKYTADARKLSDEEFLKRCAEVVEEARQLPTQDSWYDGDDGAQGIWYDEDGEEVNEEGEEEGNEEGDDDDERSD
ncbi:P-loop containing nucleoside triphosphate hydrolase protein [Exidia glandulosa HHB12029]|uniref:p-loop containing nucleoside triphosphate hydrolase protein n=1 Tax=Exidia glandulosa HHB12029 TaxID=1314781 RepID=A0A166AG46_EXIGL|nr:P-loop containing nucleoside triphosphate hydrolase protein [Exidia glandulosa HHB12029]